MARNNIDRYSYSGDQKEFGPHPSTSSEQCRCTMRMDACNRSSKLDADDFERESASRRVPEQGMSGIACKL